MHIALAYVASLDGKIAKPDGGRVADWASKEDGVLLTQLISHFEVIVLGRTTYEKQHPGLHKERLYIVMTHHPEAFAEDEVPEQREFTSDDPDLLVEKLTERGYESMLLLTGGELSTAFLKSGLVNELYLTIEPFFMGAGAPMVASEVLDIPARLDNVARMNDHGTLLAHYLLDSNPIES